MSDERPLPWHDLDRARRKGIVAAVSHGRAVDDPRDAPLAVAFATSYDSRVRKPLRSLVRFSIFLAVQLAIVSFGGFDLRSLAPAVFLLFLATWGLIWGPIYRRRAAAAEHRNRALMEQLALPPVTLEFPEPDRKTARFLRFGDVLLLGWVIVAIVLALAPGVTGSPAHTVDVQSLSGICAREHSEVLRLAPKPGLSPLDMAQAVYDIEWHTIVGIQRLTPATGRSRQEDLLLLLKTEQLTAQQEVVSALQRGDLASGAARARQARGAGDRFAAYASSLGAKACASA